MKFPLSLIKLILKLIGLIIRFLWLSLVVPLFRLIFGFTTTKSEAIKRVNNGFDGNNEIKFRYSKTEFAVKEYIEKKLQQGMTLELEGGSKYRIIQSDTKRYRKFRDKVFHWDQKIHYVKYEPDL